MAAGVSPASPNYSPGGALGGGPGGVGMALGNSSIRSPNYSPGSGPLTGMHQ